MAETFAALLLSHALVEVISRRGWPSFGSTGVLARFFPLILHVFFPVVCTGSVEPAVWFLGIGNVGIAVMALGIGREKLWSFLCVLAAFVAIAGFVAVESPEIWKAGVWGGFEVLPGVMLLFAGALFAVFTGAVAVERVLGEVDWADLPLGLKNGGAVIGRLERGLIYLLLLQGEAEVIGFLIAAKSILQLDRTKGGLASRQYIVIGSLASYFWVFGVSISVLSVNAHLPPLGIPAPTP